MMNDNNISIVEPAVDYTKIPPIHQRRTISFINHFIVTTVSFLNNFSLNCEDKLYEFENKLQKLEAAVVILESRLASIPALECKTTSTKDFNKESQETVEKKNDTKVANTEELTQAADETSEVQNNEVVSKHPLYEKYFKMINVGVPKPAVKIKMAQEGLDPSILDKPQQLISKLLTNAVEG